jgi:hypothetical protein
MTIPNGRSSIELTEQDVADRLGKSKRWVQQWLYDDVRREEGPRGQFHYFVGASKRWTEESYQALRAAILSSSAERRRGASNAARSVGIGGSMARFDLKKDQSDLEKVLEYPLTGRSTKPKRHGRI